MKSEIQLEKAGSRSEIAKPVPTASLKNYNPDPAQVSTLLLPLRLFLGLSFVAAGLDKLTDPEFFNPAASGYIGNQLSGFAVQSPLRPFLLNVAVPNALLLGWLVLLGELAVGLGTLLGLFSRAAAFFGFILSLTLWLSASWSISPFFLGSDLPYAIGWLTLALGAFHPVLSLDARISRFRATRAAGLAGNSPDLAASGIESGVPEEKARSIARRRFLEVAGATFISGAAAAVAWSNSLEAKSGSVAPQAARTSLPPISTAAPNSTVPAATAPNSTVPALATAPASTVQAATVPASTVPALTASPPASPTGAVPGPSNTNPAGKIITPLSAVGVGEALYFTTPDTNQKAVLIHKQDGAVTAFSTICTHEGCTVSFSKAQQLLVCPCHGSTFDIKTGAPNRRPARLPLPSFKVQIDPAGNVVYIQN